MNAKIPAQTNESLEELAKAGPRSRFFRVPDNALAPQLRRGDVVVIDPDVKPSHGCFELVQEERGAIFLQQHRMLTPSTLEATSNDPAAYPPIPGEQLRVLGCVMTLHRDMV